MHIVCVNFFFLCVSHINPLINCQLDTNYNVLIFKIDGVFTNALITENGIPVIYMSRNRSYFYSLQTQCWHLVPSFGNITGEGSHLLLNSSSSFSDHYKSISSLKDGSAVTGPLSIIQLRDKNSNNFLKTIDLMNRQTMPGADQLFNKQDFTLTHLESQVNAAVGLSSPKEYKFWLITYARYLAENGKLFLGY